LRDAALEALEAESSQGTAAKTLREQIETRSQWDPFWFIDQCEAASHRGTDLESPLRAIQTLEWQLLFDYSYRKAVGAD
jgi:hypothetical protein